MRLADSVRRCVVFLAHPVEHGELPEYVGTGFLVSHENHTYLVTAKHVTSAFTRDFTIVLNQTGGGILKLQLDQSGGAEWTFHKDSSVDLAVVRIQPNPELMDAMSFQSEYITTTSKLSEKGIGVGDLAYVVGLFHFVPGEERISPVVHTSHIAMYPEESIPVSKWGMSRAYLVEAKSPLSGLSGSPVFVRRTVPVDDKEIVHGSDPKGYGSLWLLGVWQATWMADESDILRAKERSGPPDFPWGMGVVVPSERILEILGYESLLKVRKRLDGSATTPATLANVREEVSLSASFRLPKLSSLSAPTDPEDGAENPQHQEDFNRLLGEVVKVSPPDD